MIKTLVVDDEYASLEIVKHLVEQNHLNFHVCATATNVQDAIEAIKCEQPDLLVLDLELSGGDRFEILEHFPALKAHVIFVTAYDHYAIKALRYKAFE